MNNTPPARNCRRKPRLETLEPRTMLASDSIVAIELAVVDVDGQPISQIEVGTEFILRGTSRDLRTDAKGVFAAYADVSYDEALVAVAGELEISAGFPAGPSGDVSEPGLIDDVGGFREPNRGPFDTSQEVVFEIPFVSQGGGEVMFAAGPADDIPQHYVLVFGDDSPVSPSAIDYGFVRLQIGDSTVNPPSPWRNPGNPYDVNDDGVVTIADVQAVEDDLAANGEHALSAPDAGASPPPYIDISGDRHLRQDDLDLIRDQFAPDHPDPPSTPHRPSIPNPPQCAGCSSVAIELTVVDVDGQPLSQIDVGTEFILRGKARDLRSREEGVFAAYADVSYDEALVAVAGEIYISGAFPAGPSGDTSEPGLIDDVGGFRHPDLDPESALVEPFDISQEVVFEIPFVGQSDGEVVFAAGPADESPNHDVLVLGDNSPVSPSAIDYGFVRLQIGDSTVNPPSPWRNPGNPFDVNDDGEVTIADVQAVEDDLAANGEHALSAPDAGASPPPYVDVTGDRHLRQDDLELIRDQFAPDHPDPPSTPYPPVPSDLHCNDSVFARLRCFLPSVEFLEDGNFPVRIEVVNTRTNEATTTVQVGDVLRVRAYFSGLDVELPNHPVLALYLFSGQAANVAYDPDHFSVFPAIGGSQGGSMKYFRRTGDSRLLDFQLVAKQAGTSTIASQFDDEPPAENLSLYAPVDSGIEPDHPGWEELMELFDKAFEHASASIEVLPADISLVSQDDSYQLGGQIPLVVSATDGLLSNDTYSASAAGLRAVLVSEPSNGDVVVQADGSFVYNPRHNFDGSDQFVYAVTTDEGTSNLSTATISGELPEHLVQIVVRPVNEQNEPVETVRVGEPFFLQGLVEDLRGAPAGERRGVSQVSLQTSFDSRFTSINGNPASIGGDVIINERYRALPFGHGAYVQGERINVAGHFGFWGPGTGQHELFRVPMLAVAEGTADFAIENISKMGIVRWGADVPEHMIDIMTAPLTISAGSAWQNPTEPLDTNNDGRVSPVDALFGINRLNARGPAKLAPEDMNDNGARVYLDANGDRFHSPVDVLKTINELNAQAALEAEAEHAGSFSTVLPEANLANQTGATRPVQHARSDDKPLSKTETLSSQPLPRHAPPAVDPHGSRNVTTVQTARESVFEDEDLLSEIEHGLHPL